MEEQRKTAAGYALSIAKWLLAAAVLGALCGLAGGVFHKTIDLVTETRMEHTWLLWLLPVAGVLTLLCYKICKVPLGTGTNLVLQTTKTGERVPILLAPLIFIGTTLSHLCGASVGREGAALQLGGSLGHNFGRLLHFKEDDTKVLSMCGMAACFAALFGTPFTAAVFVLEVVCVGTLPTFGLLPCVISAYSASLTAKALGVAPLSFTPAEGIPELTAVTALHAAGFGIVIGLLGIVFCLALHKAGHFAEKLIKNPYLRVAAGGLLMAIVTTVFGLYDFAGAGTQVITRAINTAQAEPAAFLIKLVLAALCVGVGFRGGEIVPTMFVGATFGCVVGPLLGLPAGFSAALGLIALFCSVVNCPLASAVLAVELFGTAQLPLFVIAIAAAFAVSGYFGLYSSQTFVFSKVKNMELNRKSM